MPVYRSFLEETRACEMTATEFHDGVLLGGRMPVEMVRARLTRQPLTRDYQSSWRFDGNPLEQP